MSYPQHDYYSLTTVSSTSWTQLDFGFVSTGILLLNQGAVTVEYSFDFENVDADRVVSGELDPNQVSKGISFDNRGRASIWLRLKTAGGSAIIRVEAWEY